MDIEIEAISPKLIEDMCRHEGQTKTSSGIKPNRRIAPGMIRGSLITECGLPEDDKGLSSSWGARVPNKIDPTMAKMKASKVLLGIERKVFKGSQSSGMMLGREWSFHEMAQWYGQRKAGLLWELHYDGIIRLAAENWAGWALDVVLMDEYDGARCSHSIVGMVVWMDQHDSKEGKSKTKEPPKSHDLGIWKY